MDSDDRTGLRKLSLLLIGGGAVLALAISSFSHEPAFLSFGLGPACVGLMLFLISFFPAGKPRKPLPRWRLLALWLLNIGIFLPQEFFNYHLHVELKHFVFIAYLIASTFLLFWPVHRHPEQTGQKSIAGSGFISN